MTTAEECRQMADEAEQAANQCNDLEARRLFKLVAEEWRHIAECASATACERIIPRRARRQ